MADITYDIDDLKTAKKAVDKLITTLDDNNKTLNDNLQNLQSEWKTDAGTKFFEDHRDTWSEYVKKYVKKLTGVSDMLQKAIDQYAKISDEVRKLSV